MNEITDKKQNGIIRKKGVVGFYQNNVESHKPNKTKCKLHVAA
jgi:hypothetical protein